MHPLFWSVNVPQGLAPPASMLRSDCSQGTAHYETQQGALLASELPECSTWMPLHAGRWN
jgi:hypothetical protein